jgi:ABC-2 type transport system permease protein
MALLNQFVEALRDIRTGWQRREGWWTLSQQAIKNSYRRTALGPIWITIQQIAFITGIGLLYSQLLKVKSADFIPLVTYGISFWGLLTSLIFGGSSVLIQHSQAIKSSTLPVSFYVFSTISQQFLNFLHSAVALVPFALILGTPPRTICVITVPLSIIFALANGFSIGLWLGPLCARFRDVSASIPILIQLVLFLSPVFWSTSLLGDRDWIIHYNPIAWMIETFRSPILGGSVHLDLWLRLAPFTIVNLALGIAVIGQVRDKISYWI